MTLNKLASIISKSEGLNHEASIGDIREILRIIVDLEIHSVVEDYKPEDKVSAVIAQLALDKLAKRKKKK